MTEHIKPFYEVKFAITVDSLTKIYPLYEKPVDRLKEALSLSRKKYHRDFFALDNVSFNVEKGDFLGIIGQNGSGKSTLLKLISRVLTPTSGNFTTRGRVVSLLELGAGFNYELTGMENIRFYGTILGFNKKEIESRSDAIISFADIGSFINQPLKTYSSGMKSRLAFAVASNVDPDILILDEVLAVGDLRFRQKCYRVMQEFVAANKTVLLVTHSMGAVINFCNKALWLDNGRIMDYGTSSDIVKDYTGFMTHGLQTNDRAKIPSKLIEAISRKDINQCKNVTENIFFKDISWTKMSKLASYGERGAIIEEASLYLRDKNILVGHLVGNEWLSFYAKIQIKENILNPGLGIKLKDKFGNGVFTVNNYLYERSLRPFYQGECLVIKSDFKLPNLMNGKYSVTIALSDGEQLDHIQHHWIHDAFIIEINSSSLLHQRTGNLIVLDHSHYNITLIDK